MMCLLLSPCCCCCFGVTSNIHPEPKLTTQHAAAWALAKWAIYLAGEPQARHNNSRNNNSNNRISYTRHSIRADANNAVREIKRFICRNATQSNNNNYTTFRRISFSVFLASLSHWTAAATTTRSKWNPKERRKKERSKIEDCYLWRLVFLPPPLAAGRGSHYVLALKQFEQPSLPSKFPVYPRPPRLPRRQNKWKEVV